MAKHMDLAPCVLEALAEGKTMDKVKMLLHLQRGQEDNQQLQIARRLAMDTLIKARVNKAALGA